MDAGQFEVVTFDGNLADATQDVTHDTRPDCWQVEDSYCNLEAAKSATEGMIARGHKGRIGIRLSGSRLPFLYLADKGWVEREKQEEKGKKLEFVERSKNVKGIKGM